MAELPQAKAEEWPGVKAGAETKPEPKSRKWAKHIMPGVGGGGPQGQVGGEKVLEQKLDASGDESPSAEGQWGKTGSDQKVVMGLAGQWRALENARFVPKQGDRRFLMLNISEIATRDLGVMYEWLKDNITSCRYIIPGHDTFRGIKLKTVAMLRKMLDPDGVCGVNVGETRDYRELAKKCSTLFANVAGELICQWTEKDDNDNVYFPANTIDSVLGYVDKPTGQCDREDLNKCSDENVATPDMNATEGSKAFTCIKPLHRRDVEKLTQDNAGVVMCPHHHAEQILADCVYCHARQRDLVERAEAISRKAQTEINAVEKVYFPLPSAKEIPLTSSVSRSKKKWDLPVMIGLEGIRMEIPNPDTPLARWRSNLRESLSYTILVTCPDLMINEVNKDWTDMHCIDMLEKVQRGHKLVEGTIPASVYAVAINYFTVRALDEGQKASQSIESTTLGNPDPQTAIVQDCEYVESWGLRPKLTDPGTIRKRKVILLSDSGSMRYRRPGKNNKSAKVKPGEFLNNNSSTDRWPNNMANYEVGGATWATWSVFLEKFINDYRERMELCPDGTRRFPAHISVIVLVNLNGTNLNYAI